MDKKTVSDELAFAIQHLIHRADSFECTTVGRFDGKAVAEELRRHAVSFNSVLVHLMQQLELDLNAAAPATADARDLALRESISVCDLIANRAVRANLIPQADSAAACSKAISELLDRSKP